MQSIFDKQSISIPCPKCGVNRTETLGWIKSHDSFVCSCGVTINLDKKDFVRSLDEIDRELANIPREIIIKI